MQPGGQLCQVLCNLTFTAGLGPLTLSLSLERVLPKNGTDLNLPSQWWPWAAFGLGSLTSDFFPQASFRPLALGPKSRHTTAPSIASCFHRHLSHLSTPVEQNCSLSPSQAVLCSLFPLQRPFLHHLMVKARVFSKVGLTRHPVTKQSMLSPG